MQWQIINGWYCVTACGLIIAKWDLADQLDTARNAA